MLDTPATSTSGMLTPIHMWATAHACLYGKKDGADGTVGKP
jgi:hypothetical protein